MIRHTSEGPMQTLYASVVQNNDGEYGSLDRFDDLQEAKDWYQSLVKVHGGASRYQAQNKETEQTLCADGFYIVLGVVGTEA